MAEKRHCPYSFYIPENDTKLVQFVRAQTNLSFSVRLLMKAFMAAYKDEIQDVSTADLSDLIAAVRIAELDTKAAGPAAAPKNEEARSAAAGGTEVRTAPDEEAAEPATARETAPAPEPEPEPEPETEHNAVPVPEVETDPVRPTRVIGSERSAYNAATGPEEDGTVEDIDMMNFMGES